VLLGRIVRSMQMPSAGNISGLAQSKNWQDADSSHAMVVKFHAKTNEERLKNTDYVDGKHYTQEELDFYEATHRVPITMNQLPASRRTVVGTFLRERFDVEFVPVESDDQELADTMRALAAHEDYQGDDQNQDAMLAVDAWMGATAYRYVWPETWPGESPFIGAKVLNPAAVSFDPNSKDLGARKDADFVDLDLWMSGEEIIERWPNAQVQDDVRSPQPVSAYDAIDPSRDRDHVTKGKRNGMWRVVERYYRVRGKQFCILNDEDEWIEVKNPDAFRQMFPNVKMIPRRCEYLYVAQWAPDAQTKGSDYLYNGEFHVQPRDPKTRKILWPVLELIAEQVGGSPKAFVTPLRDALKTIDVMVTGIIEVAKHASSSYDVDRSAYINKEEFERAVTMGAHANQRFKVRPGMGGKGLTPVSKATSSTDYDKGINIASTFIDQQSSTPPAMKGWNEGANPSGILNGQRIEQGNTQLAEFINNFRTYRRNLLNLRYAYWREIYTDEMVFRITGDDGKQKKYTLNKEVQAQDPHGNPIPGETTKINDINAALFDVRMVDSIKSPTARDRQLSVLGMLMQNQVVMADPDLAGAIIKEYARLTDSSSELKEEIGAAVARRSDMQAKQAQLQQMGTMQQVADREAASVPHMQEIPQGIDGEHPEQDPQTIANAEPSTQSLESVQ